MKVLFDSRVLREALRTHDFAAPSVALEFAEVSPLHRAFADVVDGRYDIAELPIVAVLQAVDAGRPLALLPLTLLGRFQHHTLVTAHPSGRVTAERLAGKRVGVRSWGQTTAVWVCGFLSADYGVNADEIDWVVYADAPVPGTAEPEYVARAAVGADLGEDLLSGAVDAAIIGHGLPADERIRTILPSPARAAAQWFGRTGVTPVNHVAVVRDDILRENSDVIAEVCTVIAETMPRTPASARLRISIRWGSMLWHPRSTSPDGTPSSRGSFRGRSLRANCGSAPRPSWARTSEGYRRHRFPRRRRCLPRATPGSTPASPR